ncbi:MULTISPECIES: VOC family protein [Streptomyces]|uniref:VOC family protein n=2 Tax=Streptomyces TaxID=1883 RepID=A0ABV9J9C6_9ACTN
MVIRDSKPHDHPLVVPVTAPSPDTTHRPHKVPEPASNRTQPLNDTALPPVVAFQRVDDFRAPRWTDSARPQQIHIDVMVADLDVAEEQVLALGETLLDGSDKPIGYRVYEDPVGHPFCLITPEGA